MRKTLMTALAILATLSLKAQEATQAQINYRKGIASFYHDKFEGRKTANGEIFNNNKYTAASNSLKLGTYVKVTNLSNGDYIYVKINDRMAASNKRLIDMASIAAKELKFHSKGVTRVTVQPVSVEEGSKGIAEQRRKRDAKNQL